MAFETVKPDFVPIGDGTEDHSKGNGITEAITFGSHSPIEAVNGPGTNLPKNAVDEWPAAQQVLSFYFVKYRPFDDPKIKAKLDAADKDVRNKADARFKIIEKIRAIRSERSKISEQITPLTKENSKLKERLDGKMKEMEPLNQALNQLRSNNSSRERGVTIFSSEEELNKHIKSLQYHIQHESIPLSEEKQILRQIKQLEGTREQVIANAAARAEIEKSLGSKADLQDQYNLMGDDFSGVKKDKKAITTKLTQLLDERSAIDKEIEKLEVELKAATENRDKAREAFQELRKKRDEGNACFYQNRSLLNVAKNLANSKDVAALEEFSNSELEKFMKMWNESKPFRDEYERRMLVSFDNRQLSRDGRMRNPDEKPLVALEPSPVVKPEQVAALKPKQIKNEPVSTLQNGVVPVEKNQKEMKSKPIKEVKSKAMEPVDLDDKEKITETEKPKKVEDKIDEAKLKEIRREEEIAKAKQALERKKKLAEKAAAKAAVKAQKEAEKKEKEREKKLKKKASASGLVPEPEEQPTEAEPEPEVAEPEKTNETTKEPSVPKSKARKASVIRNRNRPKGPDSISKVILKRKKSTNYWVWAAPAAVSVMMLFVIGYKYLF